MEGLLLVYAVVVALELVLSLIMLGTLLMSIAPRRAGGGAGGPEFGAARPVGAAEARAGMVSAPMVAGQARFPDDLERALRLAFRELSQGSRDVALLVHTRALLERYRREGVAGERG